MGCKRGQDINGVLLLDKPVDISSNHALQRCRRLLDAKKGGHTGTLDPFASGLLVCCFGKATKICGNMLNADKTYLATLHLGSETDSGDLTGTVVQSKADFGGITPGQLDDVLPQFMGIIQQIPPMYSALKRDGKPLYYYARHGIELEREARTVNVHSIKVVGFQPNKLLLDVSCSKGAYIRTLAQDIGRALGCFAHLTALRRTSVGPFNLEQAYTLEQLQKKNSSCNLADLLIPIDRLPDGLLSSK